MLIALFAPASAALLDIAGPSDVFDEANRLLGRAAYRMCLIGEGTGPLTVASGLALLVDRSIVDVGEPVDTLLVVGPREVPDPPSPTLTGWLRRTAATARRLGSARAGAFLLGAAGLLKGRQVAIAARHAGELATRFPVVAVAPDRPLVRDGRLFSSTGGGAAVELALALVEDDFGAALAHDVAGQLRVEPGRHGRSVHPVVSSMRPSTARPSMRELTAWIRQHPGNDLSIAELSRKVAMSERNFARVFRRETGMTPADYVDATRVELARRLLQDEARPVKVVAVECGFHNADALRRSFLRRLGVTPKAYRARAHSDAATLAASD